MARLSSVLLLALVALALFVSGVDAACTCKSQNEAVGPCTVNVDVCGCITRFHWKYKATASASGVSNDYSWADSGSGAGSNAVLGLLQKMNGDSMCNCQVAPIPFGKCQIQSRGCFYFANQGDMDNKVPTYRGVVTAPNGATYEVDNTNAQTAVQGAMQAMLQAQPSLAQTCNSAALSTE